MADTVPTENFRMNFEEIKINYSRSNTDSFEFRASPKGDDPVDWAPAWQSSDEWRATPDLSDEMPEDFPAGLVVYLDYDVAF